MAVLLSLTMCLSLLPVAAFAEDLKLEDANEYRDWGPHKDVELTEKDEEELANAIEEKLEENLDKELEGVEDQANDLNNATYDAIYGTETSESNPPHTADEVVGGIPSEYRTPETPEGETPENPEGETPENPEPTTPEPPSEDDSILQAADKAADAAEAFQTEVTDAVTVPVKDEDGNDTEETTTVDEVVGEAVFKTDEEGNEVVDEEGNKVIDSENSSGLVKDIAQAADDAASAATDAGQALTNAQTAVANRDQAALTAAQQDAGRAYADANTAFETADTAYNTAKDTVDAAQAAYDAAVAKLEAAGYKLDGDNSEGSEDLKAIEAALSEAKAAVDMAQTQLAAAEKARNEAELKRDTARVYAAVAAALGTSYDPQDLPLKYSDEETLKEWLSDKDNAESLEPLLKAVNALLEVGAKTQYGEGDNVAKRDSMTREELEAAYVKLVLSGDGYVDAWDDFSDTLGLKDSGSSDGVAWKLTQDHVNALEDEYGITDGGDEDLIYKVFKYALSEKVQESLKETAWGDTGDTILGKPVMGIIQVDSEYNRALNSFADSIMQYWQVEKFLDHEKENQPANKSDGKVYWKELGNMGPISYTYEVPKVGGGEDKKTVTVTLHETEDGNKSLTVDGKEYKPGDPQYKTYTALIRRELSSQLDSVRDKFFGEKYNSETKKYESPYTLLKDAIEDEIKKHPVTDLGDEYNGHRLLVGYLDLLKYELPLRADEQAYQANKDLYNSMAEQNSLMTMLLSGSKAGQDYLQQKWEEALEDPEGNGIPEEVKGMSFDELLKSDYATEVKQMCAVKLAHSLAYATEENAKYPEETAAYKFMQHIIQKQETAKQAEDELTAAVQAYDDAVKAAEDAQRRLDELLKGAEGKKAFARAVEDAKQQLADANEALAAAETERNAAQRAQVAAQADYEEAMRLAIAALPVDPENPDTPDTPDIPDDYDLGDTDDDDDDGDDPEDTDVTIEDEAVPLAAGPVTRAQFVDYLWRHEGSPEAAAPTFPDVPADHEFAPAIGWAQAAGLVSGYEDGTFQPDELVTVKMVRTILDRFDRAFGKSVVKAAALTTLTGEDGEAVLNCDEVLAEFFGEEVVPAAEDEAEIVA